MISIKKIIFTFSLFAGLLFSAANVQAQIPDQIILGLESGNAKVLAKYFNQNVELVVIDNDNVYSKAQAQQIVGNFFDQYTPDAEKGFIIIHESGKEGAKSVIGSIETTKGEIFRIYFLLKKNNEKDYIHQLRIEKQ